MFIFPVAHTLAKFYLYEQEYSRSTWHVSRLHRAIYAQDLFRLGQQAGEQIITGIIRGLLTGHDTILPNRFDKIKEWRN
jgi:hypothetical protein